jgi:predicted Zn-dependent protease
MGEEPNASTDHRRDRDRRAEAGVSRVHKTNGVVGNAELPRRGLFRGPVFLHPVLKFQYRFPDGWSTWSGGDTVIGLSPGHDAIIKLRIAPGTPVKAAKAFFSRPGIETDRITRNSINAFPAVSAEFSTPSGQTLMRGIATFIAYRGTTYQLTASTTSDEFDRRRSVLHRSIATFHQLKETDTYTAADVARTRWWWASGRKTRA